MKSTATKVGRGGTIVVPAEFCERHGLKEGTLVILEEKGDGMLIRPAIVAPMLYTWTHTWFRQSLNHTLRRWWREL